MSPPSPRHELLPWYATGTLDPRETEEFREHLETCPACREELQAVREIRDEIERHGTDLFEDHPPPERLVSAIRGELDERQTAEVRRHLALCASCATEARWIRGEAVAGGADASPAAVRPPRSWAALATAAALAALLLLPRWEFAPTFTGIVDPTFVVPTERGAAGVTRVEPGTGEPAVLLFFEIDLPARAFPVTLELRNSDGAVIFRQPGIDREALIGQVYVSFSCGRRTCPPGRYDVRVTASGELPDELEFAFEVGPP